MRYNNDGTRYSLESIEEEIEYEFENSERPNLSIILGSDWGANFPTFTNDPKEVKRRALTVARWIYKYSWD